ncbi:MAG: glycosyltransferase family 4 protein [Chloroflexi bacterium]|nr:glycosyltransferase family 4 protein [Chloroflexota bacterium]
MINKVLMVSGDVLPLPGYPTSGAGLRAWGLGQGLRAHGFQVTFGMPAVAWHSDDSALEEYGLMLWDRFNLEKKIQALRPDAVVFCHWPSVQIRKRLDVPTVIDFHGPHILERAFQEFGEPTSNALLKIEALRKADYFICAGEKQKAYFLAWLLASGIDVIKAKIDVVPVCLSPDLPEHLPADEITFVYGGVYLPWQDPTLALTVVSEVISRRSKGELRLFGGKHPIIPLQVSPTFQEIERRLRVDPRVHFEGSRPHDELIGNYQRATAAIDLMAYNYERELAFTTRTVEYMWCGLPVIYNDYADLSPLIARYEAGWVLDPNDRQALEQAIGEIIDHPDLAHGRGNNAQRLVRENLTWDRAVQPLVSFLQAPEMHPSPGPDLVSVVAQELGVKDFWQRWTSVRKKGPKLLAQSALAHFRHGGFSQLAEAGYQFAKRRIRE